MPTSFFEAVRVHPEPYRYLDERTIHETLVAAPGEYLEYLDQTLLGIAAGDIAVVHPPKLVFTDPHSGGDFRVMPCVVRRGGRACKTVKIIGTNVIQKTVQDQITVGKAVCLDEAENYVTHILEACLLSSARTGACAALALKRLAPIRRRIAIIGAGRVGCYAAFYAAALGGSDEITFFDDLPERAAAAAQVATASFDSKVRFATRSRGNPIDADVMILATTATSAVIGPADTNAQLVISTGADTEDQHELTTEWPSLANVYVDTLDGFRVGDLLAWSKAGLIQPSATMDLVTLYQKGPLTARQRKVFISTGTALFDNLTISYAIDRIPLGN